MFPVLFLSHGSPRILIEQSQSRQHLSQLGSSLGKPDAIVIITPHWLSSEVLISANAKPETIHDFYGFPDEMYQLQYPAPGSPQLAQRVHKLLEDSGIPCKIDEHRGLDHGSWAPLILSYPDADIPVVQLSTQLVSSTLHHYHVGQALRPLREEGNILIIGSGAATHNLQRIKRTEPCPAPKEITMFDDWLTEQVTTGNVDALLDIDNAPYIKENHPELDHLLPLYVALGAANDPHGKQINKEIQYATISMACFQWD